MTDLNSILFYLSKPSEFAAAVGKFAGLHHSNMNKSLHYKLTVRRSKLIYSDKMTVSLQKMF